MPNTEYDVISIADGPLCGNFTLFLLKWDFSGVDMPSNIIIYRQIRQKSVKYGDSVKYGRPYFTLFTIFHALFTIFHAVLAAAIYMTAFGLRKSSILEENLILFQNKVDVFHLLISFVT